MRHGTGACSVRCQRPTVIPDGVLGRIDADGSTTLYMEGWDLKIAVQNQRSYVRGSRWDLGVIATLGEPAPPIDLRFAKFTGNTVD